MARRTTRLIVSLATALPLLAAEATWPADPAAAAGPAAVDCAAFPAASAPRPVLAGYTAIEPRRLVDTRDGTGGVAERIGAGCTLRLDLGAAGVPADGSAVALSLTALALEPGYLTVFPCDAGRPPTSNVNPRSGGFPVANLVVALPDADREVCIFTRSASHVVVDLAGWWSDTGDQRLTSTAPARAYDSRLVGTGSRVPANRQRAIDLSGRVPAGTTAVVANLTVAAPSGDGWVVAFPCGGTAPLASNLNFAAGESRAAAAIVGLGPGDRLCVQSNVAHHIIVDISGWYAPAPQFGPTGALRPVAGRRLADTRVGTGWTTKFGAGTVRRLDPVAGLAVEPEATAVVLNLVAVQADAAGYVTAYPCDGDVPTTSVLNYAPGRQSTNLVTVDLSRGGDICLFTLAPVHLVVDLFGVVTAPDGSLAQRLEPDRHTWPPFAPDATDYGVECGDGPLQIAVDPASDTTVAVDGVAVGAGTVAVPVSEDQLVPVRFRRGTEQVTYWFRCLPADFSQLQVERPGRPAPGWYLTSFADPVTGASFLAILDEHGAPVWYKRTERQLIDVQLRSDGLILATATTGRTFGIDPARGYRVMNLAGDLLDELTTVPDPADPGTVYPTDHHDYVELAGGSRALLTYPLLRNQDLTAIGPAYFADETIADGVIQEIDATDHLLWTWRASDHFGYDEVTFPQRFALYPTEPHGGEVDVWHLNSMYRVPDGTGDYVVSARHLDAVFRIDRGTGDVRWILGSLPANAPNKGGAPRLRIVGDPLGGPRRSHDARLVGDVLTLFDNRTQLAEPARAVAYRIDESAGTATMLWQIAEPQGRWSGGLGTNRVAADGSVLVNWGGGLQPMFEEYGPDDDLLLRITQVGGGASYRIVKYAPGTFAASVLRANAGGAADAP